MVGVDVLAGILFLMVAALAVLLPIGVVWLVVKLLLAIGWVLARVIGFVFRSIGAVAGRLWTFASSEVRDSLGLVGSLLAAVFFVPLVVGSIALGRWSRVGHYGRALEDEVVSFGLSLYRVALGHPIRLLGLNALTDGLERRLPAAVASSPGRVPKSKKGEPVFPGYALTGTLPRGGSGAVLYLAEPLPEIHDRLAREGKPCPGRVVVKSFSLEQGSTLPQIVRESRALGSARDLGLVLDYELDEGRFWYVMPYVPGDDLAQVTRRMHDRSGPEGLDEDRLEAAMAHMDDVLASLDRFHGKGLWHKDIKPSNVIVSQDGRAYLVDLGLVTPLRSAMTLTTHGTEYFRDPEMVRLAMQGAKVHEVDGVKFDLYSAGAVLYSMLENSFPAHGSLSRITKRCPEALSWIVRRAMADLSNRYGSAREMLADLRTVAEAPNPWGVRPFDLPSMGGNPEMLERVAAASARGESAAYPRLVADAPSGASFRASAPPPPLRRSSRFRPRQAVSAARAAASDAARSVKQRARLGAGVLVALGLFAVMAIVPAAILVRHGGAHAGPVALSASLPPVAASLPGSPWSHRLRDFLQDPHGAVSAWSASRASCRNPENDCELHPGPAQGDFDILVLNDLPADVDPDVLDTLEEVLAEGGFEVWGLGPAASAGEREIELVAAGRKAAGLGGPTDEAGVRRLEDLVRSDADLDAVLWLGEGETSGSTLYRIVAPPESGDERVVALTVGPFGEVVSHN